MQKFRNPLLNGYLPNPKKEVSEVVSVFHFFGVFRSFSVSSVASAFEIKSNHKVEFEEGTCKEQCEKLMKDFFKDLRGKKKKASDSELNPKS